MITNTGCSKHNVQVDQCVERNSIWPGEVRHDSYDQPHTQKSIGRPVFCKFSRVGDKPDSSNIQYLTVTLMFASYLLLFFFYPCTILLFLWLGKGLKSASATYYFRCALIKFYWSSVVMKASFSYFIHTQVDSWNQPVLNNVEQGLVPTVVLLRLEPAIYPLQVKLCNHSTTWLHFCLMQVH